MKVSRVDGLGAVRVITILALALGLAACGGRQSTASKSAVAYSEARSKGVEIGGGHDHGGHAVPDVSTSSAGDMGGMDHSQHAAGGSAGMDHSQHATERAGGMDHSRMQSGSMAGMDHSQMKSGSMAGVDHSQMKSGSMAGMDHSQMQSGSMAAMDHSQPAAGNTTGMDHSQHGSGGVIPPGGLWGPVSGSLTPAISAPAPEEAGVLAPDRLDAAAPVSVREAGKSSGESHEGHEMEKKENHR